MRPHLLGTAAVTFEEFPTILFSLIIGLLLANLLLVRR